MTTYYYRFGYNGPLDLADDDFESSGLFVINASDEEAAMRWGHVLSEWYVNRLSGGAIPWKDADYANWIEQQPDDGIVALASKLSNFDAGEYPDFELVRSAFRD